MKLLVPSLVIPAIGVQSVVVKSEFCCNVKPAMEIGQEIFRLLPECATANGGVGAGAGPDWIGFARRPKKRMLPVWVSRMKKMNG